MIDPTIALSFKSPESPVEMQAKVQALQTQRLQQQQAQQALQSGALELQMKQRAMQDQEIARQAYMDSGGDVDQYQTLLMKRGASPQTIFAFRKQLLDQREQLSKVNGQDLKNTAERHDALRGSMESFGQQSAQFKEQNWPVFLAQQVRSGAMTPQEAQQLGPQYPGDDQLKLTVNSLATGSQLAKEAMERQNAEAAKARAAAQTQQANTAQTRLDLERPALEATNKLKTLEAAGQKPIQPHEQAQLDIQAKNAENNVTEAELAYRATHDPDPQRRADANAALKRLDQSKIASRPVTNVTIPGMPPAGSGGPNQTTGDAYLNSLPPSVAAQVKAIADGRAAIPSASARTPAAQQIRDAVFRYDPGFSEQRAQLRKAFMTGPDGRNIGNLNTAAVHLDQLAEAAKAMDNGSFRPGNDIWNKARAMFGSSLPTNFEGIKQAVAGEMANALKGQASDPEIAHIAATINGASSGQQLADIVNTHLHTLGAKLNTYDERYHSQSTPDDQWSPLYPSAKSVYEKHGIQPIQRLGGGSNGANAAPAGKIAVISPEGVPGFIDADKWDAAQKRGFKRR